MQNIESSPVMKRNPRPRKYASDAERQAAYRSRNVIVEFRAETQTAEKLNQIAETIDVSRSDLLLSMVKFALTNHDWARFGLTHKTIPLYKGNPMATKKPSPAQLSARQKFADMVRARAAAARGKKIPRKNAVKKNPLFISATADKSLGYYGSRGYIRKLLEDFAASGRVVSVRQKRGSNSIGVSFSGGREMTLENARKYLENALEQGIFKSSETKPFRMNNPMESALLHLSGTKYGQVKQEGHIYTAYVLQKVNTGIGEEMDLLDSKSFKTKSGAANWIAKNYGRQTNPRKKTVSQKISQLEHEGYPHKQSIAIALSEQRKGKVKRNPMMSSSQLARIKKELQETERLLAKEIMNYSVQNQDEQLIDFYHKHISKLKKALESGKLEDVLKSSNVKRNPSGEIPAYAIVRNFKVLGIFQTKNDAIKAAQGISDATGKTLGIKPVQVMAGHFNK